MERKTSSKFYLGRNHKQHPYMKNFQLFQPLSEQQRFYFLIIPRSPKELLKECH